MAAAPYRPDPAILALGQGAPFFDAVEPALFPACILRYRNQRWAERIGLGALTDEDWIGHFGRFHPLKDNLDRPLALRYHGHQFRVYNPEIGDGRGFLFAQLRDDENRLLDLGTKGSGKTPYSRTADGRLTLKGGVREILATEMLEALGVYTSKTLSLIETGEALQRNDEPSPTRSSVLVRLSHSHVRFGTFQRLAFEGDRDGIARLVDYCVAHFDPDLAAPPAAAAEGRSPSPARASRGGGGEVFGADAAQSAARFFERVVARTARLVGEWTAAGFVHGVLNSDNMNVTGESFDYGPWRFAPAADPAFTAAYFDQTGLYAFGRQAEACAWNLARLGGALTLVADAAALNAGLAGFAQAYEEGLADAFFRRLGLERAGTDDFTLVSGLLRWMEATRAPFEQVLFDWFCAQPERAARSPLASLYDAPDFAGAEAMLLGATPVRLERLAHPYFSRARPCTMLIDEVEALWAPISQADDWGPLNAKLAQIAAMRQAYKGGGP
jgi:uncharacterized protein YdiU (UPF0061 family)